MQLKVWRELLIRLSHPFSRSVNVRSKFDQSGLKRLLKSLKFGFLKPADTLQPALYIFTLVNWVLFSMQVITLESGPRVGWQVLQESLAADFKEDITPIEYLTLRVLVYLWFLKSRMGDSAFRFQVPLLWNYLPIWIQKTNTISTFKIRLTTVRPGSDNPESSLSQDAIGPSWWGLPILQCFHVYVKK